MKQVIAPQNQPTDVISIDDTNVTPEGKLYGVEHKKIEENGKRFKVHVRPNDNKIELIGFRNCTGHLNEEQAFTDLQAVFDYCKAKSHTLLEFDDKEDFGAWLLS